MAIVFWVGASANSNTVTLPAGAAEGMFAIVQAFRADSATAPSLPAGWSAIGTNAIGVTTKSERTGYKKLTAADITAGNIGTWTNAQRVILGVYHSNSGDSIEYVSGQAQEGDSTTALQIYTMTAGCSMVVCLGHSTSTTIRDKAFTNFVNRSAAFTSLSAMLVDSDGLIGNTANNSLAATGDDWVSRRVNLVEVPVIVFDAVTTSTSATMSLTGANTSSTVFAITARVAAVSPTIPASFANLGTIVAGSFWTGSLVTKRLTNAEITTGSIAGFTNSTSMIAMFYSANGTNIDARAVATNSASTGTLVGLPAQTATGEQLQVAIAAHRTATNLKSGTATGYTNKSSGVTPTNVGGWEAATNPVGAVNVTVSPSQEWLAYSFLLTLNYDFGTTTAISSGPKVATPALVQKHIFAAPASVDSVPVVGVPTLTQKHALTATGISSVPVDSIPTLTQRHALTGTAVASTPVVGVPALTQKHIFAAPPEIDSTPVVATPALVQKHGLTAIGVASTPIVDTPVLLQNFILSATGILSTPVVGVPISSVNPPPIASVPVVATPALSQRHVISIAELVCNPVVANPTLTQKHTLLATGIRVDTEVASPVVAELVQLFATGISAVPVVERATGLLEGANFPIGITVTPVVGNPSLGGKHFLSAVGLIAEPKVRSWADCVANNLRSTVVLDRPRLGVNPTGVTSTPVVATPVLTQVHDLDATGISVDLAVTTVTMRQRHVITALGHVVEPDITASTSTQQHRLVAVGLVCSPDVSSLPLRQNHSMGSVGVQVTPTIPEPTLRQNHFDPSDKIEATPVVGHPGLTQNQAGSATGISVAPKVGSPPVSQRHRLVATGVTVSPVNPTPTVAVFPGLIVVQVKATPVVGAPTLNEAYRLTAQGISCRVKTTPGPAISLSNLFSVAGLTVTPVVGTPQLRQRHPLQATGISVSSRVSVNALTQKHSLSATSIVVWSTVSPRRNFVQILTGQT